MGLTLGLGLVTIPAQQGGCSSTKNLRNQCRRRGWHSINRAWNGIPSRTGHRTRGSQFTTTAVICPNRCHSCAKPIPVQNVFQTVWHSSYPPAAQQRSPYACAMPSPCLVQTSVYSTKTYWTHTIFKPKHGASLLSGPPHTTSMTLSGR